MKKPLVGIIMGSDSDLPIMQEAAKILEFFENKKKNSHDSFLGVLCRPRTLHDDFLVALLVHCGRAELTLIALLVETPEISF